MERLITSHLNAFMINKPKFVKNVLLTTIPTRVLGITVRACIVISFSFFSQRLPNAQFFVENFLYRSCALEVIHP